MVPWSESPSIVFIQNVRFFFFLDIIHKTFEDKMLLLRYYGQEKKEKMLMALSTALTAYYVKIVFVCLFWSGNICPVEIKVAFSKESQL